METFCPPKPLVTNPDYAAKRLRALSALERAEIDPPIDDLIHRLTRLPYCFTLQSCHGHFLCQPDDAPDNNKPIPANHGGEVSYRIAYLALCIEDSAKGRAFLDALASLTRVDPGYVQFGSAGWFWDQWVNSYVLQVEPAAYQFKDRAQLEAVEARHVERVRNHFFEQLARLISAHTS